MWTYTTEIKSASPGLRTHRLLITVDGVKPFVYVNDVYEHVASVSDMHLLPEDTGALYRSNTIDLIFRVEYYAVELLSLVEENLGKLYTTYTEVIEVTDEILLQGPEAWREGSHWRN